MAEAKKLNFIKSTVTLQEMNLESQGNGHTVQSILAKQIVLLLQKDTS